MSGKKDGKKGHPPRNRRATDFDEPVVPIPKSKHPHGRPHRGLGSIGDQLDPLIEHLELKQQSEVIGKGFDAYLDLERETSEHLFGGRGSRTGFEKRPNTRTGSGYKVNAERNKSAPYPHKGRSSSTESTKECNVNTKAENSTADDIAANARTKADAAEEAYARGKAEGKAEGKTEGRREGVEEAMRQAAEKAKDETKGIWKKIKEKANEHRGKLGVIVGALGTVGTTVAVATYRTRQGDRMVYSQPDGTTMSAGPEGTATTTPGEQPATGGRGRR